MRPGSIKGTENHANGRTEEEARVLARFMSEALLEARKVGTRCIVPVGAGVVVQGQITGRGHNSSILASDPAAHAEIMALREAERSAQNYRLAERGTGVG